MTGIVTILGLIVIVALGFFLFDENDWWNP